MPLRRNWEGTQSWPGAFAWSLVCYSAVEAAVSENWKNTQLFLKGLNKIPKEMQIKSSPACGFELYVLPFLKFHFVLPKREASIF